MLPERLDLAERRLLERGADVQRTSCEHEWKAQGKASVLVIGSTVEMTQKSRCRLCRGYRFTVVQGEAPMSDDATIGAQTETLRRVTT